MTSSKVHGVSMVEVRPIGKFPPYILTSAKPAIKMGIRCSVLKNLPSYLFCSRTKKARILLRGLDASGKTTILYKLNRPNEKLLIIPTIGFNVETVTTVDNIFTMWDVGGGDKIKPLLVNYFPVSSQPLLLHRKYSYPFMWIGFTMALKKLARGYFEGGNIVGHGYMSCNLFSKNVHLCRIASLTPRVHGKVCPLSKSL